MKKEPFRSLLITSLLYIVFFGILILNELDIRLFPPRETEPIELAFQLSGTSDNPDAETPKEPEIKPPPSSGSQEIITTSDPSDFNAVLVNKVDTSQTKNDSTKGNSGNNNDSSGTSANTFGNGTGDGYIYDVSLISEYPKFLGGDVNLFRKWIVENITNNKNYNIKSTDKGILIVAFLIDKQGEVKNVTIVKGINETLDKEVVRIFYSSPRWEPAEQQGHPKSFQYSIKLHF